MDFTASYDMFLSEEHEILRKTVREFAEKEVAPHIREWDRSGAKADDGPETRPYIRPLLERMGELGLLGICFPMSYGGTGMDYLALAVVCEELERVDSFLRVVLSVHTGLNSLSLFQWGTEEQKQKYLVPQAQGQKLAAYCLTEPNSGTDASAMDATARREGDYYVLNGEKTWISLADIADNFLVFAKTDPSKGARGITAFIVERTFDGVQSHPIHGKLGMRAGNTGSVVLQDVRVPLANRLGEEGEGFKIAMAALDNGRYTVAAGATGLIQASLEASLRYAQERQTFGVPIADQAISELFGDVKQFRYHLHPPFLRALGWQKKIPFGKWFEPGFQLLMRMKRLRGTRFDPFGKARVRQVERALIGEYRSLIERALVELAPPTYERAIALAQLPDIIRGYEDVKLANVQRFHEQVQALGFANAVATTKELVA